MSSFSKENIILAVFAKSSFLPHIAFELGEKVIAHEVLARVHSRHFNAGVDYLQLFSFVKCMAAMCLKD